MLKDCLTGCRARSQGWCRFWAWGWGSSWLLEDGWHLLLQLQVAKAGSERLGASEHGRGMLLSFQRSPSCCLSGGLWTIEAGGSLSVADRASTLSLDTDSLRLALPVAFGCHGSRKKWGEMETPGKQMQKLDSSVFLPGFEDDICDSHR